MMARRAQSIIWYAVAALMVLSTACGSTPRPAPGEDAAKDNSQMSAAEAAPVFLQRPVNLCAGVSVPAGEVRAQMLVDASGSMTGFARPTVIHSYVQWFQRTASGVSNLEFSVQPSGIYAFSRSLGVKRLNPAAGPPTYAVGADTNLDEAVRHAEEADITVILTDGAPYAGEGSVGDCASGADAGCVARRMLEFVTRVPSGGVWILPTVSRYDGPFYTEGQTVPADPGFASGVVNKAREVFPHCPVDLRVSARGSSSAPLMYSGPRTLLIVILAKRAEWGREFLRGMLEYASAVGVSPLGESLRSFDCGTSQIGALIPVELYPGTIPPVAALKASFDEEARSGTIDFSVAREGNPLTIEIGCDATDPGEVPVWLDLVTAPAGAACQPLYLLPGLEFALRAQEQEPDAGRVSAGMVRSSRVLSAASSEGARGPVIEVVLQCSGAPASPCAGGPPASLELSAQVSYRAAADMMAGGSPTGGGVLLLSVATENLASEPYKVLGFKPLLVQFLRGLQRGTSGHPVATIHLCRSS